MAYSFSKVRMPRLKSWRRWDLQLNGDGESEGWGGANQSDTKAFVHTWTTHKYLQTRNDNCLLAVIGFASLPTNPTAPPLPTNLFRAGSATDTTATIHTENGQVHTLTFSYENINKLFNKRTLTMFPSIAWSIVNMYRSIDIVHRPWSHHRHSGVYKIHEMDDRSCNVQRRWSEF